MKYPLADGAEGLQFWARTTPGRHLGVFPEGAANWDWIAAQVRARGAASTAPGSDPGVRVLSLFGYTGLATLAAAAAGAHVTHVDASKKSVSWARENQALGGHEDRPIRWIVEDALAYVQREAKRGVRYDGILLDPPKFGRGPKGQVWELYQSLPALLRLCRSCLVERPLFLVATVYAVRASAIHIAQALQECLAGSGGRMECGELVTREASRERLLSQAVFARWGADAV